MLADRKIIEARFAEVEETMIAGLAGPRFGRRPARGAKPLLLLLHGGAFLGGQAQDVVPLARHIAEGSAVVQTLSYPTAPTHSFPIAIDSLTQALAWMGNARRELAGKAAPLYVAGVEAGANLAAALALRARDDHHPALAGQILIAPMLDPRMGSAAMREANQGTADCVFARGWQQYLGDGRHAEHPYGVPMAATRLAGVAPALIVVADGDPTRDDGLRYAERLRAAGVPATELLLPARADPNTAWSRLLVEQVRLFFASTAPAAFA
jgi:acetyl esterase/lipase